jgi:hypothetical protein|tara:strand:+ start:387 stop:590 length:204 start_codon:yes stop_codon:yes gene_type:complete
MEDKNIVKLENLIHRLCGVPYFQEKPLAEIDDEYEIQVFETVEDNITYLLGLLEDCIDYMDSEDEEE